MADAYKNLAVSAVATAPSPATSGTSLVVTAGQAARFPTPPFNASVWPLGVLPDPTTTEIIRVTGISTDTLTILRAQEGTTARAILVGDLLAQTVTKKLLDELPPSAHHATHEAGGTDAVTLAQSQITGLPAALAGKLDTTDPSVTNARTPTAHAASHSSGGADPVPVTNLAGYPGGTTTYLRADGTFGTPTGTGGSGTVTHTVGALAAGNLAVGNASADLKTAAATDGQIPIGNSSDGSVTLTTLTAGAGITITNAAAAVTIAGATSVIRRQVTVILDGGGSAITTGVKAYLSLPVAGTWKKWRVLSIDSAATAGSIVIDVWKDTYTNYPPTVADTITASAKPTLSSAAKNESSTLTSWTTVFSAGDVLGFNVDSVATVTKVLLSLEFE